jgi:N6-adenosine-specific RNA methylase IME4
MKYDVILADPPWIFQHWSKTYISKKDARNHYDCMTLEDICNLPVKELANDNCALFLWTCWPHLRKSFEVLDSWGFEYRTEAWVWVKAKKNGDGFHFGLGYYTRGNTEPCLLAVKGKMSVSAHDVPALIYTPVREHSRKPDEQYGKIERLYPNMKYLELFARHQRAGWDVFGNEVENSISF